MLIPLADLIRDYNLKISGVLHIGAHLGEEAEAYDEAGIKNVIWVEGNPDLIEPLEAKVRPLGHVVINALVGAEDAGEVVFHITNNGQSSSVLEFGTHAVVSPDVHFTHDIKARLWKVDSFMIHYQSEMNFLNLDLQGYELEALKGAVEQLERFEYIYTEVNHDELYKGCVRIGDLDRWLADRGFQRKATAWAGGYPGKPFGVGWGDALYVRTRR